MGKRRVEFYTICNAALTESPGAPVQILQADPCRTKIWITTTGVIAIGESAAAVSSAVATQGYFLVPGTVNGGYNANVAFEMCTTESLWMLGYTGGTPAVVRLLIEREA